jgi:hypothetical protein
VIVALIGPIKHWWDCWDSQEHKQYLLWRQALSEALVDEGHLVYRPHEAFKGQWNEAAQRVNDMALATADVVVNMTPYGVPSYGTDDEIDYARRYNVTVVNAGPPNFSNPEVNKRLAKAFVSTLLVQVEQQRTSNTDLLKIVRSLLWALDNPGGGQAQDFIREARDALGVNTKEKP